MKIEKIISKKKLIWMSCIFVASMLFALVVCDWLVIRATKKLITSNTNELTKMNCALVLCTSSTLSNGRKNLYFEYRIEAAKKLYLTGTIKNLIISGDNGRENYSEPDDMRIALIKRGIPDSAIHLDFAGFRTYDSVIRSKKIFDQDSIIIVSQPFHNERAVYMAQHLGIYAEGFNAKDVQVNYGFKTQIREKFARVKLFLDLYIWGTKPKFLGPKVKI